jgi:hypothetical protein
MGQFVKAISVKVKDLIDITPKAVKLITFDGREHIVPKSQVFGMDGVLSSDASEAYIIAEFIVREKGIQHSKDNSVWVNRITGEYKRTTRWHKIANTIILKHVPVSKTPIQTDPDDELIR